MLPVERAWPAITGFTPAIQTTDGFQCGNDKFTTFRSERLVEGVFRLVEKDKGDVTAMSNLDPVFTIKKSTCDKAPYTPSAIYWTLK